MVMMVLIVMMALVFLMKLGWLVLGGGGGWVGLLSALGCLKKKRVRLRWGEVWCQLQRRWHGVELRGT